MQKFLTKREQLIFYLTMGVIAFGVLFNIFLSPLLQEYDNLNREINLTRSKLQKYSRLISQKDYILAKYDKLSSVLKLPQENESGVLSALSEMENIAKASNVHIVDIRPQSQRGGSAYKEAYIDIRAEADLANFLRFIYGIENSFSVLKIKKFQINARPGSTALEGIFTISQFSVAD
jgi:hypothetical protein